MDGSVIPIKLPSVPREVDYGDLGDFYVALKTWERACTGIVSKSTNVQPPPLPTRDGYTAWSRWNHAMEAYQAVFAS
jgi:hypothetical protein